MFKKEKISHQFGLTHVCSKYFYEKFSCIYFTQIPKLGAVCSVKRGFQSHSSFSYGPLFLSPKSVHSKWLSVNWTIWEWKQKIFEWDPVFAIREDFTSILWKTSARGSFPLPGLPQQISLLIHRCSSWGHSAPQLPSGDPRKRLIGLGVVVLRVLRLTRGRELNEWPLALPMLGRENCSSRLFVSDMGTESMWTVLGSAQLYDRKHQEVNR